MMGEGAKNAETWQEERPAVASPWIPLAKAAVYLDTTPNALRIAVHRGQLVPDGRGHRGTLLFFAETLDRFAVERLRRYDGPRYGNGRGQAGPHDRETQRESNEVSRSAQPGRRRYLLRYQARDPKTGAYRDRENIIEDCPSPAKARRSARG